MKNIRIVLFTLPLWALFACTQPKNEAAELAALREQKAKIEARIAELEKKQRAQKEVNRPAQTVSLQEVALQPFRHYIDLQGRIVAEQSVSVTSKMPGVLTRILVKNGEYVQKGQLLAQLDDEVMLKSMAELELQLKTAQDLYERQKALWEQRIGTEVQYIQAKANKDALEQRLATTREQWHQTRIYAPISGTVDQVLLKVGQAISPGVPLCQIVNLSQLKVSGEVPENYAAAVKRGDPVQLYFPDLNEEVTSRITYVSPTISPTNRTFTVEAALPERNKSYRANMIAVMKIADYVNPKAIVLPVNLIYQEGDGQNYVFVAEKNGDENRAIVRRVPVRVGRTYNGMVEILNGLKPGEWVITSGIQDLTGGEWVAY
ncbi:MAG: efflux RND transporter periplasmic adaptor subunit [Saprospiraceae bacterium]|nr:efflux RND transporter periplasmic adaptor subunit [Saprospiraceae bacterium]MDW8484691.1 efflux RND transporter periplasmic adaptor subunit [Saprospiraceae bacterium]